MYTIGMCLHTSQHVTSYAITPFQVMCGSACYYNTKKKLGVLICPVHIRMDMCGYVCIYTFPGKIYTAWNVHTQKHGECK